MTTRLWRRKLIFSAAAMVFAAVLFEIILRVFGYGAYILFEPDQDLLAVGCGHAAAPVGRGSGEGVGGARS